MKKNRKFETQIVNLSLISSVLLLLLLIVVMVYSKISIWLILLTALIGSLLIIYIYFRIQQLLTSQFRSLSNLLDAMIQGEYSLRARSNQSQGALGELVHSINSVAIRLSEQRWASVESQLLVRTILEHIDVAIVAISESNKIVFLNPAAKKLLLLHNDDSNAQLLEQLSFVQSLSSGCNQVVELSLGHQQGRFNVHIEEYRESGQQHKLLFITDVRTLLRSEERKAWQNLVRVISHEINNSLSPIASIGQTLSRIIQRENINDINSKDVIEGLSIITERANGLSRFVNSYRQLAKLPEPKKVNTSILSLIEKISLLYKHHHIQINSNNDVQLLIDPILFEQVIINLIKNSIEAMSLSKSEEVVKNGIISVEWYTTDHNFTLIICDQGCGIGNIENLFVPFYTTKKHGSGIGLVFCRQVIEAHYGRLSITNRENSQGCCASIEVPIHS